VTHASEKNPVRILFVCYGNICRSPMAAGLARKRLGEQAEVCSAGIAALGGPAADEAVLVMKIIYGTDISRHVARPLSDYDLATFDYIIALDFAIYSRLNDLAVIPEEKLYGWDIEDPLGLGLDAYKEAALKIERRLQQFLLSVGLDH